MIDRKSAMSDRCRCGECGGALVLEEHLVLTCESCGTLHGDAGLLADPTTSGEWIDRGHSEECGWTRHRHGADCHPDCPTCHGQQFKNAGLLADPTTSRTDAETDVINFATQLVEAWGKAGEPGDPLARISVAGQRLAAAVDRLAAPGPKEAT